LECGDWSPLFKALTSQRTPKEPMTVIINRQRRRKINEKQWVDFVDRTLQAISIDKREANIVFVSDAAIRKLNREFRGKDYPTDVLSFPSQTEVFEKEMQLDLGDVVISVERAAEQARENKLTCENEIQQLILHGLLHLCGYDHETDQGQMNRLELKLRKKLGI
jgi:probable rRNA maturation factor